MAKPVRLRKDGKPHRGSMPPAYPKPGPVPAPKTPIVLDPTEEQRLTDVLPGLIQNTGLGLRGIKRSLHRAHAGAPYEPTFEDRALVAIWAGIGTPNHVIASELAVDEKTLLLHFSPELDQAEPKAVARVASRLYADAMGGNTTAQIFFLKTRGHWRDESKQPGSDAENPLHIQLDIVKSLMGSVRDMKRAKITGTTIEHHDEEDDDIVGSRGGN